MNPRTTKLVARFAIGMGLLLLGLAGPARAQVGTSNSSEEVSEASAVYFAAWPPEDPDPVPWIRYNMRTGLAETLYETGEEAADDLPSIATRVVSDRTLVAWARPSGTGSDVVLSCFEAGAWTEPVVLAGTADDERDPSLAIAPDAAVHVLYWVQGRTPGVYHRQAPADLSAWSEPVRVSGPKETASRPRAVFHEGVLHVVYEVHDFGFGIAPKRIVLARLERGAFVPETVAATSNAGPARPEVHSQGGRLWVEWVDAPDEVAWTLRDAEGRFGPLRYEKFASAMEREIFVRGTIRHRAVAEP